MSVGKVQGVQQAVVDAIIGNPSVFGKWEGNALPYMYTDIKGNMTTGTGNLIEGGLYLTLPWKNPDGSPASQAQIQAAYDAVKAGFPGVMSTGSQSLSNIRLDAEGLATIMLHTVASFAPNLIKSFPNFPTLPADAQLALYSIAWPWGSAFAETPTWINSGIKDAIAKKDFVRAGQIMKAASQHEESINSGIIPRDNANLVMFANAQANKHSPSKLFYPNLYKGGIPWKQILLGAAGGLGGFLLGGPVGAAVGVGAMTGGPVVLSKVPHPKLPAAIVPAALRGPVDPKAVQTKLNALGYAPPLTVDGDIGPKSEAAIKWLQSARGISPTGQVDTATRKALGV